MYHRFENLRNDQLKLRTFVKDLNKEEVIIKIIFYTK